MGAMKKHLRLHTPRTKKPGTVQASAHRKKQVQFGNAAVEAALRESEEKYRSLTNNIPLGIFRSTPGAKGKFLEVNPALVRMLGYRSKKELLGIDVAAIYDHPADRMRFSRNISAKRTPHHEEMVLRKKNGRHIVVAMTALAIRDKKGKTMFFDGMVEDITDRKGAEEQRQIQKTFLEILFNSAPEAIVLHDNKDHIVNVNTEFTRVFGYSREEAIGKPINQLVASPGLLREAKIVSKQVLTGHRVEIDTKRKRKDGTLVDVSILGAPIIHRGRQMGDYAIYRDITQRKKSEEDLRVQTAYLERLFNSAPEAIVWHDNNDCIISVNDEFTRMFGYSREEAIGQRINDLVATPELLAHANDLSYKVGHGRRVESEAKRRRKDGTLFDVSILGAPIFHGGKQMGVYAVYRDISDRMKTQEELEIQETFFEKLFNAAPEAIILHDNNDIVVDVNQEFTRMFGYAHAESVGRHINDLVASDEFLEEANELSVHVIHGRRVELDSKRRRKDGTLIDVSILGAPIVHEGKQLAIYAIYRDITERKKAEEVRVRLKEEARMARNIQTNLLPKGHPEIAGYDIAGKNVPALNVGGDYYDFIRLDEDRIAIGLGDVSGKGLAASLVMANVQATIRGLALFDDDPRDCMEKANRLLFRSTDSRTFVSLFYGILDTRRHTIRYSNAGQDMPILFSAAGKCIRLGTRGIALGMKENVVYEEEEISIHPEDRLLIYSDGISEAMNKELEEFGQERIERVIRKNSADRAEVLVEKIFSAVSTHLGPLSPNDDMTVVLIRRPE
jgi:PAS domain S-box-containing protein